MPSLTPSLTPNTYHAKPTTTYLMTYPIYDMAETMMHDMVRMTILIKIFMIRAVRAHVRMRVDHSTHPCAGTCS